MTRKSLTRTQRVKVFLDGHGVCHLCGLRIDAQKQPWQVEHRVPLHMGGSDDASNMSPAHVSCHAVKTAGEARTRAKCDRLRASHLGVKRKTSRPIPGSRSTNFKRRFDGSVVRRDAP